MQEIWGLAFNGVMYVDIAITGIPLDIAMVMRNLAVCESEPTLIVGNIIHLANGIGLSLFLGYVILPISVRVKKCQY